MERYSQKFCFRLGILIRVWQSESLFFSDEWPKNVVVLQKIQHLNMKPQIHVPLGKSNLFSFLLRKERKLDQLRRISLQKVNDQTAGPPRSSNFKKRTFTMNLFDECSEIGRKLFEGQCLSFFTLMWVEQLCFFSFLFFVFKFSYFFTNFC